MNGVAKNVVKEKVLTAAKILKLEDYLDRRPKALSGGQRQRCYWSGYCAGQEFFV